MRTRFEHISFHTKGRYILIMLFRATVVLVGLLVSPILKTPCHVHCAKITTDQKFEACRKQLRLIGLVASIDPERDVARSCKIPCARGQ
jgi:hypothetical protein